MGRSMIQSGVVHLPENVGVSRPHRVTSNSVALRRGLRDAAVLQMFDDKTGSVGSRLQLIRAFNFSIVDLILGQGPLR